MNFRREQLENDPNWYTSIGEQFWKSNYRNKHFHAVCDQNGNCLDHYDEDDPHESLTSLIKHVAKNKKVQGVVAVTIAALLTDAVLYKGKFRKKAKKAIFSSELL